MATCVHHCPAHPAMPLGRAGAIYYRARTFFSSITFGLVVVAVFYALCVLLYGTTLLLARWFSGASLTPRTLWTPRLGQAERACYRIAIGAAATTGLYAGALTMTILLAISIGLSAVALLLTTRRTTEADEEAKADA